LKLLRMRSEYLETGIDYILQNTEK
jgi:hypothetical protein